MGERWMSAYWQTPSTVDYFLSIAIIVYTQTHKEHRPPETEREKLWRVNIGDSHPELPPC